MRSNTMLIKVASSVGILMGNVGLAYVVSAILARALGLEGFGLYSIVIATVTVLTVPAFFGLPTLLSKEVAAGTARGDFGLVRGLVRRSHQFIFISACVMTVGALAYLAIMRIQSPAFLWGLPLVFLLSMAAARSAMLRGVGKVLHGQWPEQLLRPALLIGMVSGSALVGWKIDPAAAVAFTAVAAALALAINVLQWLVVRPSELSAAKTRYNDRAWISALVPFALSTGILIVSTQVSLILLGFLASPAQAALFRVSAQTAQLCALGYTAVIMNISPRLAAAAAKGDTGTMRSTALNGAVFATLFSLPLALVMTLGGPLLLATMFGREFAPGAPTLAILAGGQVLNAAFGCGASILNMSGFERDCTKSLLLGLIAQVLACCALIPLWGPTGAALASVIGVVGSNIALWLVARKRTGINAAVWAWRPKL